MKGSFGPNKIDNIGSTTSCEPYVTVHSLGEFPSLTFVVDPSSLPLLAYSNASALGFIR